MHYEKEKRTFRIRKELKQIHGMVRLVIWRQLFRISARSLATLIFPVSIQANARTESKSGSDRFLANPFQQIIHKSSYYLIPYSAKLLTATKNHKVKTKNDVDRGLNVKLKACRYGESIPRDLPKPSPLPVPVQRAGVCYGELLALRPTPNLENHPFLASRDCLFNTGDNPAHATFRLRHPATRRCAMLNLVRVE